MTKRGLTDAKDRFFSAIVYLIPLYYSLRFASFVLQQIPPLRVILIPLAPIGAVYNSIPFASLIIFFVLYLAVVRNERISHFIRFNTLQAILLDIALFLISLLGRILGAGFIWEIFSSVVFLGTLIACGYSIFQSARGFYAEMPTISDAAYAQLR